MNAFIIGNGFDLAHNMPTSYTDFHAFLAKQFPDMDADYLYVPTKVTAPDGEDVVSKDDVAAMLCYLLNGICGDDWSDFENALGKINLLECFDDLEAVYDKDVDRNLWHEAYNNEDRTADLACAVQIIKVLFSEWIESIKLADQRLQDFLKLIDPENDLFITFNYTHTLERLYGCKKVIHMHGEVGGEIIVGHNGLTDYSEENPIIPIGCYNLLQGVYDGLRKDTNRVINMHYNELKVVSNCENIYSYGFSYSNVDLPYIKTICTLIKDIKVNWFFNDYDNAKIDYYMKVLLNNKFSGDFCKYSISKN